MVAMKLYEERENRPQTEPRYDRLVEAWFGQGNFDAAAAAKDPKVINEITESLETLGQDNWFGLLQQYVVEERFLYGKTDKEIADQISRHTELLVQQLLNKSLRQLRHPNMGKPVAQAMAAYKIQQED